MKKKIYKILGVALALVLVFSLFGAFVPVKQVEAQAYTPNQWNAMSLPGPGGLGLVAGSRIADFAVAADGNTIYLVDNSAAWGVAKSTNGGRSFSWLFQAATAPVGWTAANFPGAIAVAPDNPDCAALIEVDTPIGGADIVWITTNGGATWASLLAPNAGAVATEVITDIAVSPARTGTILNRDYAVSTVDTAGVAAFGDLYVIGTTTTWAPLSVVALGALSFDFTSLALAPNWVGDRVVVGVGSDNLAAGNPELGGVNGDTYLVAINVATGALAGPQVVSLDSAASDSPPGVGGGGAAIVSSDIALPADFDSTSVGNFRAFVGWTSTIVGVLVCADDVYRVDFNAVRKLEIRPAVSIHSISYFGTVGGGTLMAGESATTGVWFSSNPQVALPTWGFSFKPPTGTAGVGVSNTIVALTSDTNAFGAATGGNGAFSGTLDGGLSFNGYTFIDEAIVTISDVMPSPDGSVIFMATADATVNHSLWRGVGFPAPGSWERVNFQTLAAPVQFTGPSTIIRVSPDYLTDTTLYWFDYDPAGAAAGVRIQRSTDAGQMYGTRTAPLMVMDATVESADVLYIISGTNVYTSTNGAWFFGLPINPGLGPLYSIAMAPSYPNVPVAGNILVGGTGGGVALSADANATWMPLLSFIGGATNVVVLGDEGYATNNTVYAGSFTATQGVWRYNVGSSSAWENIRGIGAGATMTGLAQHGGVLYGGWTVAGAAAPVLVPGDTFAITNTNAAAPDNGNITVVTGSVRVSTVTALAVLLVNGAAAPLGVVVTAGQTATWLIPAASVPATDSIVVESLTANTNGTWTAGAATAVGAITVNTSLTAWVTTGLPGGSFSLPAAEIPVGVVGAGASGAERTLGPTIPAYAAAFWDSMTVGAAAAVFAATPSALRIAGTDTSTSAWAIDTAGVALMAYNDEMALAQSTLTVPDVVPFDSVTGGSAEFTASWTNISNALFWELEIHANPGCSQRVLTTGAAYMPPFPPGPTFVVVVNSLVAGRDYYARVRARDEMPGDAIRSQWSSVEKFSVTAGERVEVSYLGVQPLGPVPGATDVPLSPGFTWSPYASSTKYEFQLATDAGFSAILAEAKLATTGYKYEDKLSYGTTYFWRARGIEPTVTDWSPVSSFTTEKAPPAPPAPPPAPPTPAAPVVTPAIIWAIIAIGAILVIAVIVLILRTRRIA